MAVSITRKSKQLNILFRIQDSRSKASYSTILEGIDVSAGPSGTLVIRIDENTLMDLALKPRAMRERLGEVPSDRYPEPDDEEPAQMGLM